MYFKDIIGQRSVIEHLIRSADAGRISHAQLFTGAPGTGVLPLAIAYARYLNCIHRLPGESCGVCPSCFKINELAHPDLHFVFPVNTPKGKSSGEKPMSDQFISQWRKLISATNGYFTEAAWYTALEIDNKQGIISTFEADEIIRKLSFKSFESEYKIVIIWMPERMNTQSSNKLLKIIEEPWEKTVFLMISQSPEQLLPTILSRTQEIHVPGITPEEMIPVLRVRHGMTPSEAEKMARLSQGDLLEAQRLLEHHRTEDSFFSLFVQLMRLSYEDRHMELLEWAETLASMGREMQKQWLENALRLIRDSYMLTAGVPRIAFLYGREEEFCRKFAPYINNRNIESLITEMELTLRQIAQNGNPRIVFPHFALTISKLINRI